MILIETHRLNLQTLTRMDVSEDYADWLNDTEINRYIKKMPRQTVGSCKDYVRSYMDTSKKALIGIFTKDYLHIGNITLTDINKRDKKACIGVCIGRKEYHSKGFGKEAVKHIINYCFNDIDLWDVEAYIDKDNRASLNLFTGLGFKKIEERKTDYIFIKKRRQELKEAV